VRVQDLQELQAKHYYSCKYFCLLFRIDGHKILVEATSYTKQCLAEALVDGCNPLIKKSQPMVEC